MAQEYLSNAQMNHLQIFAILFSGQRTEKRIDEKKKIYLVLKIVQETPHLR